MLSSADIDVTHKLRVLLKEYVMQCGYKRAVYFEVYIQKNTKASLTKINYNECFEYILDRLLTLTLHHLYKSLLVLHPNNK